MDNDTRLLEMALRTEPTDIKTALRFSNAYLRSGELREAYLTLLEADAVFPDIPEVKALLNQINLTDFANYEMVSGRNYNDGLQTLRAGDTSLQPYVIIDGEKLARPLDLSEIAKSRLEEYALIDDQRLARPLDGLWEIFLWKILKLRLEDPWEIGKSRLTNPIPSGEHQKSCAAIAYRAEDPDNFKFIRRSKELIILQRNPSRYLRLEPGQYENIAGTVLNRKRAKYRKPLEEKEVLDHEGWNAIIPDPELLKDYVKLAFAELKMNPIHADTEKGMTFDIRSQEEISEITEDRLHALDMYYLSFGSGTSDRHDLTSSPQFARVVPK